jgi:hypothetical protein
LNNQPIKISIFYKETDISAILQHEMYIILFVNYFYLNFLISTVHSNNKWRINGVLMTSIKTSINTSVERIFKTYTQVVDVC